METIERHEAFSYLMLWDCVIYACAKSPVALRSVYTSWLHENKYEEVNYCHKIILQRYTKHINVYLFFLQNLLHFLFRAMPVEILKNHSTKQLNNDIFKGLSWSQVKGN